MLIYLGGVGSKFISAAGHPDAMDKW